MEAERSVNSELKRKSREGIWERKSYEGRRRGRRGQVERYVEREVSKDREVLRLKKGCNFNEKNTQWQYHYLLR